jgi:hypothetical protein
MKSMSPEAQKLIDEVKASPDAPPAGAQERIRKALDARIAAGDPGPSDMQPTSGPGSLRRILVGLVFVIGVAAGILWKKSTEPASSPASVPPSPVIASVPARAPAPPLVAAVPVPQEPPAAAPASEAPPLPSRSIPHPVPRIPLAPLPRKSPPVEAEKPAPEKPPEETCGIAGELKLLQQAQRNLQERKAEEVLTALQQASKACPGEGLEQERLALRILALCQLGRSDDARSGIARLEKDAPQSPSLGRIHAECDALIHAP